MTGPSPMPSRRASASSRAWGGNRSTSTALVMTVTASAGDAPLHQPVAHAVGQGDDGVGLEHERRLEARLDLVVGARRGQLG